MPNDARKNRLRIIGSLGVLAVVFLLAAIAQLTGDDTPNVVASEAKVAQDQPRAVFGGESDLPKVEPASPEPTPVPEPESIRARSDDSVPTLLEINTFLNRWRASIVNGNMDAQTILYAPRMEHFFRKRNVSRATVRREKARMRELYPEVNKYDISDVRVESAKKNEAVVTFRKDWDMRGDRRFAGAERQRLKLRRIAGDWKIVSEEETKVYWVKRG